MNTNRPAFGPDPDLLALVPHGDLTTLTAAGWTFDEYSSGYPSFRRGDMVLTFYAGINDEWSVSFDSSEDECGSGSTIREALADAINNAEYRAAGFRDELGRLARGGAP